MTWLYCILTVSCTNNDNERVKSRATVGNSCATMISHKYVSFVTEPAGLRILSCPGKRTWPVIISARIQAADHTSTVTSGRQILFWTEIESDPFEKYLFPKPTCLTVVHPVEYDLWSSVPAGHHITSHLGLCVPRQAEVQDLVRKN